MKLYLVTAECGDYYCGCGGGHLVGVYDARAKAEMASEYSKEVRHGYNPKLEPTYKTFPWGQQVTEVELNALPPLAEHRR